jgi:hypothetical protein
MNMGQMETGRRIVGPWSAALLGLMLVGCGQSNTPEAKVGAIAGGPVAPTPVGAAALPDLGAAATGEVAALYAGAFEGGSSVEPTWSLVVDPDFVEFRRDNLDAISGFAPQRSVFERGARVVAGDLIVTLVAEPCIPDEGQPPQPYRVNVLFEGVDYPGCARRTAGGPAVRTRWSDQLPALLPAIDQCLDLAESKPARVTIATVREEAGQSLQIVRLRESDGGRGECTVDGAGQARYVAGLADRDAMAGEFDPVFTRAPNPPPRSTCNADVRGADGAVIGVVTPRRC